MRPLASPWPHNGELYRSSRRLIIKLALGEAPDTVPTADAVRRGLAEPATLTGHGPIDRIVRQLGGPARITCLHSAAAGWGHPGVAQRAFDDIEQVTGLARTFRIDLAGPLSIDTLVDALRQLTMVESASPHYICALLLTPPMAASLDADDPWAARRTVRAAEALAYEPGDPALVLAVVDTGVSQEHPELVGLLRAGFDTVQLGAGDLAAGVELLGDRDDEDPDPEDEVGHGTACAAIIGARGEAIPPGMAGACAVLPIRGLGSARFPGRGELVGVGALADLDAGVKLAIDLGAKVINMSFGTPVTLLAPGDPLPHADVVRYGLARGCVLVAASGNSGRAERIYPAAFDGVIAVGAVDDAGRPAAFSTAGLHVTLAAPGVRVASAGLRGYQRVTGTSFAAPFVAGAAALLVSRAARRAVPLDGAFVQRLLCSSAQPWPAGVGNGHGAGILDAHAALRQLDAELDRAHGRHGQRAEPLLVNRGM
jgi:subtilisin family serine protease